MLGRKQKVVVQGSPSEWYDVISGVPQDTDLGPVLFLAYVMDLDVGTHWVVSCFADDTKVMRSISRPEDRH